jgi:type II secretory pathway component PulF
MIHTSLEIEAAASAIANQLAASIPILEVVGRMVKLQPKHAEFWQQSADVISRGGRLSTPLAEVWPDNIVAAVKAGEETGTLPAVMKRTAQSLRLAAEVKKSASKLISPVIAFLAGAGVFIFYMVGVIPKLQESLGGAEGNIVFKVSHFMHSNITAYWPYLLAGLVASIYYGYTWIKQESSIQWLISVANNWSLTGPAVRNLYFGMWAYQMALLDTSGLPIKQQLLLSAKTLPDCLQEGVLLMAAQVEKRGRADSADPDMQPEDDPRREWPFYIATAFMNAHETGVLDVEMERIAPILIEEGTKQLNKAIGVADLSAKASAAIMIALPMMGYFAQLASSLTNSFK